MQRVQRLFQPPADPRQIADMGRTRPIVLDRQFWRADCGQLGADIGVARRQPPCLDQSLDRLGPAADESAGR